MQLFAALLVGAASAALGLIVMSRSTQRLVGWLLVGHGVSIAAMLGFAESAATSRTGMVVDQLTQGLWVLLFIWLALVAYLLPDGRLSSTFWRVWVRIGLVGVGLFVVGAAGDRDSFAAAHDGRPAPLQWLPPTVSDVVGSTGLVLVVLLLGGSVVSLWQRLRHAQGDERTRLLWPVWGSLTVPVVLVFGWVNEFLLGSREWPFTIALGLLGIALPATVAIALLRHGLFDIEMVLSRTVTYAALTALVVGSYAGLLALADRLVGERSVGGFVAVGLVAVAVHPTYAWLRTRVERWVYGLRSDPREAISLLADRAATADPDGVLAAVTDAVATATRATRAWITPPGDREPATIREPLVHRGQALGDLAIELPPGRAPSADDLALVRDLARHASLLVRSEQLNDDLRESRSRIVTGREEERRRLRRDLHDGLGPSLAAIALRLNAAQSRNDASERVALIAEAREEVRAAITEVRRLVDDLRPPAIDEVGLLGAMRQRAAALSGDVTFDVTGPADLRTLPAAVEVAAFRIVSEAMTNVTSHSGATRCRVVVAAGTELVVTITDNGVGTNEQTGSGVGWASMHERASELGGTCEITSRPGGGLVVRAVLPLGQQPPVAPEPALHLELDRPVEVVP